MKTFTCPKCGGHHFGRETKLNRSTGHVEPTDAVRCHDEHKTGCRWRGTWDEESDPK